MATSLLQKARQRKMIYFGAIVALFTVSLMHREFVLKPQATRLQLRETGRGEADLTSSAVMLTLSGSRGLAVTILWYNAMEKQRRSEWNELELIVKAITKLQPYFITPWLYQSWNIAFNVAVECDRPRDKYYYISRGIDLASEGERRNSGSVEKPLPGEPEPFVIPGNPELRQFIGFIYQLKIGNSDERNTMRSLLELSCIDPVERNPDRFWMSDTKQEVNLKEFAAFCEKYPRLIRRLHEQRRLSDQRIVQFFHDSQNVPSRFKAIDKSKQSTVNESELKDPLEQFPILPPPQRQGSPNPQARDLTSDESIDVFLVCRTWYEYAQKPLPPPDNNPGLMPADYDKLRFRVPKGMVTQLFRQYPARAQIYIAEALDSEGFFDADGWDASPSFKDWARRRNIGKADHVYGTDRKYHSREAWKRGYDAYKEYGLKNGLYLSPADLKAEQALASIIRKEADLAPDQMPQQVKPEWRKGVLAKSLAAHEKLHYSGFYRQMSNFDSFLDQAEAEGDAITLAMRKYLFVAERKRLRDPESEVTVELFDEAWRLYTHACFKFPRFAQVLSMQEDVYELHQKSLGVVHKVQREKFRDAAVNGARIGHFHSGNWLAAFIQAKIVGDKEKDAQEMNNIFPMRNRYGSLDLIHYYDAPGTKALKEEFLFQWIHGANLATNMSVPQALAFPNGHEYYLLTDTTPYLDETPRAGWQQLIQPQTRDLLANRLGVNR